MIDSQEQQIYLQPITSQGLNMNVDSVAHLRQEEQQKSSESERGKSQHISTIKIDENENELEASKSIVKSELDQEYQSGISSRLEDLANLPSKELSSNAIVLKQGSDLRDSQENDDKGFNGQLIESRGEPDANNSKQISLHLSNISEDQIGEIGTDEVKLEEENARFNRIKESPSNDQRRTSDLAFRAKESSATIKREVSPQVVISPMCNTSKKHGNNSAGQTQSSGDQIRENVSSKNEKESVVSRRSSGGLPMGTRKTLGGMSSNKDTDIKDTSSLFIISHNDDLPSQMTTNRSKKKTKSTREIKFRFKDKAQKSSERSEVLNKFDADKQDKQQDTKKYKTTRPDKESLLASSFNSKQGGEVR